MLGMHGGNIPNLQGSCWTQRCRMIRKVKHVFRVAGKDGLEIMARTRIASRCSARKREAVYGRSHGRRVVNEQESGVDYA